MKVPPASQRSLRNGKGVSIIFRQINREAGSLITHTHTHTHVRTFIGHHFAPADRQIKRATDTHSHKNGHYFIGWKGGVDRVQKNEHFDYVITVWQPNNIQIHLARTLTPTHRACRTHIVCLCYSSCY